MEYLYRCYSYATNGEMRISIERFDITKRTKCGVWIDNHGAKKFINQNARKQWACKTKEEAKESFILRKESQIKILSGQLYNAKLALKILTDDKLSDKTNIQGGIPQNYFGI